jgi:tRNA1Val (adenine37-N6)-methyltransferase
MARNRWFQFKQFRIEQQRAAMKVGTDGVLLGAWCNVDNVSRLLDIGTGTGLIALMAAQRSAAAVDAIELNEEAAADARFNFLQSPWSNRITLYCIDFLHYCQQTNNRYDLIVSNPPFFVRSLQPDNEGVAMARHNDTLPFDRLLAGVARLLMPNGRLAVIIPADSFDHFREEARLAGLYLSQQCMVYPKPGKRAKRVMLEFSMQATYPVKQEITIHTEENRYTLEYSSLTQPFYLDK